MPARSSKNDSTGSDYPLPHDLDAERSILASILLDNGACSEALELLKPEDFFRPSHQQIFDVMRVLFEQGQPIDPTTLATGLRQRDQLDSVGGVTALSALLDGYANPANLEAYARTVKDKSMLRQALEVCRDGIDACRRGDKDAQTIIEELERRIFEVGEARIRGGFVPVADVARTQLHRVETAQENSGRLTGLATGFTDFDRLTNGLQSSDLIIVAARPSAGKTAFCLNIAQHAAVEDGKCVGIFSLEMSKESLVMRLLCAQSRVDSQRLRSGYLNRDEWKKLAEALEVMTTAQIFIDDTPGISVAEMRAKARRLKAQHKRLDLLIVDYLQLVRGRGRAENRQTEVSQISRDLKGLAKELDVPLIALSQLSRASETRADHRPLLSDLRESGSIEQDADVVAFIFREEMYNPTEDNAGRAELIVAKQRNGPTGTVDLAFIKTCTRFDNAWGESL
ncbi:MAG: replicative DNA helicase [Chloracidobacterium sp.]|uniref:Replicative DNA helicase n=1 Tax=Chloracidobacterium validum TaxID=2821543 RepID=A0ABX8BG68_9BACT|nr:replicative DNA helicase [Chloracidobacterium validum]QUW04505.1 replicative DNA helicase [Chloracidobacterium validum]